MFYMLPCPVHYVLLSPNPTVHEKLSPLLEGNITNCELDLKTVVNHCMQYPPHTLIVDTEDTQVTSTWIFTLRKQFEAAAFPIVVILHERDAHFEESVAFLSRVTIFHAHEETWDTLAIFSEMLVDEYLRDPFYERKPNLQTIHQLSQLWMRQKSARIYYGRLNEDGTWIDGHRLHLHRGGLHSLTASEGFKHLLCDPNPTIELIDDTGFGDWLSVGELLYDALKPWTKAGFLRIRQWYALSPNGLKADIAKDLPLSLPTRKLLFGKFAENSCIADRLKILQLRSTQVEAELEILVRLGLYTLDPNASIDQQHSYIQKSLPHVPPERWAPFLVESLEEIRVRALSQNLWKRFEWNAEAPLQQQLDQTLHQLTLFKSIDTPDSRRSWDQISDIAHNTYTTLTRWAHTWSAFEPLSDDEYSVLFDALSSMRRMDVARALTILDSPEHPFLKGLQAWVHCNYAFDISDRLTVPDKSVIKDALLILTHVLDKAQKPVPRFEYYAVIMHMMLEHWPMATKRLQRLPNSHQKRSLDWAIRCKNIPRNLFAFHMW